MTLRCPRRYYLAKRHAAAETDTGLDWVWRAKQEAEPGAPLPLTFPCASRLAAGGYTTTEDIRGADSAELQKRAGLTLREAQHVLLELSKLP